MYSKDENMNKVFSLSTPKFKFPGMPDLTKIKDIYNKIKGIFSFKTLLVVPMVFGYLFIAGILYYSFETILLGGAIFYGLYLLIWINLYMDNRRIYDHGP